MEVLIPLFLAFLAVCYMFYLIVQAIIAINKIIDANRKKIQELEKRNEEFIKRINRRQK